MKQVNWQDTIITPDVLVEQAIKILNKTGAQFILVCDERMKLLGTISDGDVRKSFLRGVTMTDFASTMMNEGATSVTASTPLDVVTKLFQTKNFKGIPVIDDDGIVIDCYFNEYFTGNRYASVPMLIMAGGFGRRLGDLTKATPKPMLEVGGKPIIHHIVETAANEGLRKIYISVHYLSEQIEAYFGDGRAFDLDIQYIRETKPLDTGGSFRLIDEVSGPVLVTNADIISKIGYCSFLDFHQASRPQATMAVHSHVISNEFGVVHTDGIRVTHFEEKPKWKTQVNAGVYVVDASSKQLIKPDEAVSMPAVLERIIEINGIVNVFPLHEEWLDVGTTKNYERVSELK